MRKIISIILTFILFIMIVVPTYAEDYDKALEEAILKVKSLFNISNQYDKFNYNINSFNDRTIFRLSWNDSHNRIGSINVEIDEDGNILHYSKYKPYLHREKLAIPKVSKDNALKITEDFISKINPKVKDKIKYIDNNQPLNINDRYYYFHYIRIENGIPYYQNNIEVTVDNMTGEIHSYNCNWDYSLVFPSEEGIIALEEAKEKYKDKIGLKLVYKIRYEDETAEPFVVYTSLKNEASIDAKTGDVVTNRFYYYGGEMIQESRADVIGYGDSLTPEEKDAVENVSDLITKEEAEKVGREFLNIDKTYKLMSIRLLSNWRNKDEFYWYMDFVKQNDDNQISMNISIDGKTGELKSFSKFIPYKKEDKAKYNKEETLEIAKDFIKSIEPEKYNQIEYTNFNEPIYITNNENKPRDYTFSFTRKINDGYFIDNGFNLIVSAVTGEIIRYEHSWYKGGLPDISSIISLEDAYKILFEDIGMELEYIRDYSGEPQLKGEPQETSKYELRLVYSIKRHKPLNIDVYTGKLLYGNGTPYEERKIIQYKDIDKSYSKNQIKILAQYGISLPGDEFKPKQEINQKEFLYLVMKAKNYYFDIPLDDSEKNDNELYDRLIREGIIKEEEKSPQSTVTKEDAIKFIIRALGYDKVADIKGIFTVPFADAEEISPDLKGYVAIAYGLNIIKGEGNVLNPSANITREEAAIMVYNLLNI